MIEHVQPNQQAEPGPPQEPTPKSQAEATEELSDEQLDQVAGGLKIKWLDGESE